MSFKHILKSLLKYNQEVLQKTIYPIKISPYTLAVNIFPSEHKI